MREQREGGGERKEGGGTPADFRVLGYDLKREEIMFRTPRAALKEKPHSEERRGSMTERQWCISLTQSEEG